MVLAGIVSKHRRPEGSNLVQNSNAPRRGRWFGFNIGHGRNYKRRILCIIAQNSENSMRVCINPLALVNVCDTTCT